MQAPLWVKIGMSLGFSILGLFAINTIGQMMFHSGEEASHGGEEVAAVHETEEPASTFDLAAALATAEADEGSVKKCVACHTFDKGGDNKIGPNLWNIVGLEKASHEGFGYSAALQGLGGTWTYEDLFHFLSNPKNFASGTKMTFAGFKKEKDAVAVIAYLRTLSDAPVALPAAEAADEVADEAVDEAMDAAEEAAPVAEEVVEDAAEDMEAAADEAVEEAAEEVAPVAEEAAAAAEEVEEAATTEEEVAGGRFASADVDKGERVFKKCQTCHTPEQGGANKIGPNLWNVMTRGKGTHEGFNFSADLAGAGGQWTVEDLDAFLTNPKAFMSGTKMTFAGLKKDTDRTNVIAYLATLSDTPVELE
ncbi:MAG: cytochrome c family protein [Alphaproteobacteria bacterium]|nr:MAG: cytochrome c family protein [Alphaproteobacteria bacterium]